MNQPLQGKLDQIGRRFNANAKVNGLSLAIEQPAREFAWSFGNTHQQFFIASITKLFTTAMIMQLRHEGLLTLETPVAQLIGEDTMSGLVIHRGHDYAAEITVRELLAHTSGIPDFFDQKRPDGSTFVADALKADSLVGFDQIMQMTRELPSPFPPATAGKAHYGDTNYELLGRIIEVVTAQDFGQAVATRILDSLGLTSTWLFTEQTLDRYGEQASVFYGRIPVSAPKTIASTPASGAIVSTPSEQLRFLRAFMTGELFPSEYLTEMASNWRSVFSPAVPLDYGTGLMRFKLPRWQSPFAPVPEMIGHSGSLGTVLYYVPQHDLYISGTVNQMRHPSLPYPLLAQLAGVFN